MFNTGQKQISAWQVGINNPNNTVYYNAKVKVGEATFLPNAD